VARGAYCIAFLLLVVAVLPCGARGLDVKEIVRNVQARYDATRDLTADVTQEMTIASLGKTTTARGTVMFKKPGKMRWDLDGGDPQVIVADGTTLWLYQPKEQQVLKTPFDAAFRSTTPISFLTGVGRLADDFDASVAGESADKKFLYLDLLPRRHTEALGRLHLTVARDTFDIRSAAVHDPFGNVTKLQFDHIERNRGISDDRFAFQPPPGVDVITAPVGQ
jgi:outer membrane lipoprotein carrier protein